MRTHITLTATLLLAAGMLGGCAEDGMTDDIAAADAEVVSTWLDALESQDIAAAIDLMTDDVVWETRASFTGDTSAEALPRHVGRDEVMAFFAQLAAGFESTHFSARTVYATDEGVVFAELQGDFQPRGGGQPYRNLYMFKVVIEDGLVARIDEYFNPIHAAMALGIDLCAGN